jgi:hypothetical protein
VARNKFVLLLIIAFVCSCSGCGIFSNQKYTCDAGDVKSIQIVCLREFNKEEYRYEYDILADVADVSAFVERLNAIKQSVHWSDPAVLRAGYLVIKIDYANGDYDLLHHSALMEYRSGGFNYEYIEFNTSQFDKLVSDYLQ